MLAPTRLRLLNVGIERPRFPDLIIDMRADGNPAEVVIMLQNGGGKSTLNSMWLHAYEPQRSQFLARLAIKQQRKSGKLKEFEHYIPAGSTTYVVCEHAISGASPDLFGVVPRLVVGYAAWRIPDSDRADERFFCFQTTTDLNFDTLPLRRPDGGPVAHEAFFDHLTEAKRRDPALQLVETSDPVYWKQELTNRGFDLDFLRRFLLKMNLDEGAADRLFTYDSPREFLNSVIDVLAEDADRQAVATEQKRLSAKLANRESDRATETFLIGAIKLLEPLAGAADGWQKQCRARADALDRSSDTAEVVAQWMAVGASALAKVEAVQQSARDLQRSARERRRRLVARQAALLLRQRELEMAQVRGDIEDADRAYGDAKHRRTVAHACVSICRVRAASQQKQHALERLDDLVRDAAPLRQKLIASMNELAARYASTAEAQAGQAADLDREERAQREERAETEAAITAAAAEALTAQRDLDDIVDQRKAADGLRRELRRDGVLAPEESSHTALHRHRGTAQARRYEASSCVDEAQRRDSEAARAARAARGLQPRMEAMAGQVTRAEQQLADWRTRTDDLAKDLLDANIVETTGIDIDQHAEVFSAALRAEEEERRSAARTQTIRVSQLGRDAEELERTSLLPPRPEVETLAATIRAATNRTVKPGWQWLADFPDPAEAAALATRHPELADGLIVAVDDDYGPITTWLAGNAASLRLPAPIVVGTAAAITSAADPDSALRCVVLLPDEAHWDRRAGAAAADRVRESYESALATRDNAEDRIRALTRLAHQLDRWQEEIGCGGLARLEEDLLGYRGEYAALAQEQEKLHRLSEEASHTASELRTRAETLRDLAAGADHLARQVEPLMKFDEAEPDRAQRESDAQGRLDNARRRDQEAQTRRVDLQARETATQQRRLQLSIAQNELVRKDHALTALITSHPGTPGVDATLENMSTDALERHVQTLDREYTGLVTDQELRAAVAVAEADMRRENDNLDALPAAAVAKAREQYAAAPQTPLQVWQRAVDSADQEVTSADRHRSQLAERRRAAQESVDAARQQPGATTELDLRYRTGDLATVRSGTDETMQGIATAEADNHRAGSTLDSASKTHAQLAKAVSTIGDRLAGQLDATATALAAAGPLGYDIDLEDIRFAAREAGRASQHPVALQATSTQAALEEAAATADPLALTPALDRFASTELATLVTAAIGELDHVNHRYRQAERQAHGLAEKVRTFSLKAADLVAKKVVGKLQTATIEELITQAAANHRDAIQRLAAVQSELRNFETELDVSAKAVRTTVETLRNRVRTMAGRSRLPDDPRLGVWSGQQFLKISWSDSSREGRLAQIRHAFQYLINPENRPAGAKETDKNILHQLVEAITPNLRVEVLIPKVPFDGRHYSIDELTMRTSGGEGVTAAIIIAALMLSMRTPGHTEQTFLIVDNIFAKVVEPALLRLIQHVTHGLRVQLVLLTPSRDEHALSVFANWIQLKVETTSNLQTVVAPAALPSTAIPQQLRREPLVASPNALGMSAAKISVTNQLIGAEAPNLPPSSQTAGDQDGEHR